jgi:phage shock protein E
MTIKKRLSIPLLLLLLMQSAVTWADAVWIDVRSAEEHAVDNIEGDPRITHDEIVERVSERYPDKTTEIHLYCRSGGRAGQATDALKQAGYTNITNEGGIDDARETRGLSR